MASQPQRSPPGGAGGGGGRRSFLPAPKRTSGIPTPSSSIPVPSSLSSSIPTLFHSQTPSSTGQLVNRSQKPPAEVSKGSPHREKAPQVQEVIPGAENLVVGERIRISGVKPGILRYVGRTHIAPGFWCGIELYDASGLHDGEVDGQRYFTCKPFRGIFAPVDKVVPDESQPVEEKRPQVTSYTDYSGKAGRLDYGKISESGKFPSQAGLTRGEAEGGEKGGLKSAPGESGYRISAFNIRRRGGQDTSEAGYHKSRMSSTSHGDSQDPDRATAADEAEVCSRQVKEHLQSDSRRYFNLTFGRDTPPLPHPHSNLPDLLSSVSPPSPQEEAAGGGGGGPSHRESSHTQGACDISDIHLDFKEGGQERGLMEGIAVGRHTIPATSESDASLSGHSSSLEEASVATVMEVVRGEPKPASRAGEDAKAVEEASRSSGRDSVDRTADDRRKAGRHKPRTTSTSGRAAEEEEGSNEVSPEVSQVLEWDYDHDAFDGKLLEKGQDGMSTSTSESESSAGPGGVAAATDKAIPELDTPAPQDAEGVHEFEENEDGFEAIDNIADFPLGMGREGKHLMTDSGISERDFQEVASEEPSKRKSVEFDSNVKVVPTSSYYGGGMVVVRGGGEGRGESRLKADLMDGHKKQERPLSLLSTGSADTGYVADTDTEEAGTLTANSPTTDTTTTVPEPRQTGTPHSALRNHVTPPPSSSSITTSSSSSSSSHRPRQGRGSGTEAMKVAEIGRDLNREDAARLENRHSTEKPVFQDESEESEEEEEDEEEEEETSEEETTSEEEESQEEDDDDEEESEEETEEESEEEESEDDRIEADRNGPQARTSIASAGSHDGRVAPPATASSNQNQAMNGSMVVGSEMTESTDTVSQKQAGSTADGMPSEPHPSSSQKPDPGNTSKAGSKTRKGSGSSTSKQKPKKKRSSPNSAEDKKIVAEHKKAVKSASSRLADYIKAPLPPPKPKEEKKSKKKTENKEKKSRKKSKKQDAKTSDKSKEETKEEEEKKRERRLARVREEKPKVKRTVVKSKWGNIMSQIEASKSTVKIKPKAEIQSSLAVYLSTPAPPNPKKEAAENTEPKEAPKPKPKPKLIKHPKPDFSNIKSKLNITPPPPLPRRDSNSNSGNLKSPNLKSPNALKGSTNKNSPFSSLKDPGVKPGEGRTRTNVSRKPPVPKFNAKDPADKKQEGLEKETAHSQRSGSCNSLAAADDEIKGFKPESVIHLKKNKQGNTVSRAGARLRSERASSATSTKSDTSNAQRSVKSMNQRNVQKAEQHASGEQQDKRNTAKTSSSPPAVPKKADQKKSGEGERGAGTRSSASPPKATAPSRTAWGACAGRSAADQNRNARTKAGLGLLKSGHPPDVVSTSARGSRAQEVARLESLCEARTKELNYTRMQLKAGLQAFDAMACLFNYCTTELDAFSCPAIAAKLKTASDTLSEQQHSLDRLNEEKQKTDQQLREVTEARDAAQQEVEKLKQEMQQAEEAHSAAQQKLQEEQSAALKGLKEEITSQHQETMQQMQKYQENQSEYTRQSHKRQLVELTSEHQMATNQLKVAHLEDIQALRNKHELQVEELHVQHRKKLEDITERFESIKLSLTEKVQSLCGECDDLRLRAKSSEEALQRDADVKVQLALTPFLHLPKEIESLKTVIDMRTEEIQKLRRQNMDLVKQLEELPIVQEKVVSLQQKVENLQAIINIKTDHEKQLHEKCQVLMRKYDRESKANKRLSMDYEQVVWRMSQSADFTGSLESISPRQLSRSPSRGGEHHHSHGSSPVRSLSTSSQGAESVNGVVQRQRKASGGDDDSDPRRRANTFSDTPRHRRIKGDGGDLNGPGSGSSGKRRVLSKSGDYSEMVSASSKEHEEAFSSGHESGDTSDFFSSLESNVILETAQGVSFQLLDKTASSSSAAAAAGEGCGGGAPAPAPSQDDVFVEEGVVLHAIQDVSPEETSSPDTEGRQTDVTVVVTCPSSSQ